MYGLVLNTDVPVRVRELYGEAQQGERQRELKDTQWVLVSKHPVTMRKASLISLSIRCVCALRLHTGAQYSAVKQTRARVVMRKVVASAPQPVPANRRIRATRDVKFWRKASK